MLRFLIQLLRSFDNQHQSVGKPGQPPKKLDGALDIYLSSPSLKNVLNQAAFQSKDPVL